MHAWITATPKVIRACVFAVTPGQVYKPSTTNTTEYNQHDLHVYSFTHRNRGVSTGTTTIAAFPRLN